jgi:hypothetical protein
MGADPIQMTDKADIDAHGSWCARVLRGRNMASYRACSLRQANRQPNSFPQAASF